MDNKLLQMTPLQMMQKFSEDFNRRKSQQGSRNIPCRYARHRNSHTDKMTRFLKEYQKKQGSSTITLGDLRSISDNMKTQKPARNLCSTSEIGKRRYFKDNYTESHPFLSTSHIIRQKKIDPLKGIKTQTIEKVNADRLEQVKLLSPMQSRRKTNDMKDAIVKLKDIRRQKMDCMRYNYLLNNCFKKPSAEQSKISTVPRIQHSEISTKQRIFPTPSQI